MIGRPALLILLTTLSQTVPLQIPLTVAELGGSFTLTCLISGDRTGLFYWYKLEFGYMVQTVAEGSRQKITLKGQFNNSRFAVNEENNVHFFTITNVSKKDEATYICQAGSAYEMNFTNATFLAVNDRENHQNSVYVRQSPQTESVLPGESVTLQCSLLSKNKEHRVLCPGEHDVYWFRAGSGESQPSILYTHGHSSDEEEERSCVYSLSKTLPSSSDKGTYYCAVVTCGKILFGEGTTLNTREELNPLVIVSGTLLVCCVIVIVALIIFRKQIWAHCKGGTASFNRGEHEQSAVARTNYVDGEGMELNYAALDFPSRRRERCTTNREIPPDCLYSGTRDWQ